MGVFQRSSNVFVVKGLGFSILIGIRTGSNFMGKHKHQFVDEYEGLVGFGLDRETDEKTLTWYLQKFSDDDHMALIRESLPEGRTSAAPLTEAAGEVAPSPAFAPGAS